MNEVYIHKL